MRSSHRDVVVVVGSVNIDLVATVTHLPRPGETVPAVAYAQFPGGKGGNQAVAAARLGRDVTLVGLVGDDREASLVLDSLAREGIDTTHVLGVPGTPTGRAVVLVDAEAENEIVVVAGANGRLGPAHVRAAADVVRSAAVVVTQLEVPVAAVLEAARVCVGLFILNPAPAPTRAQPLPDELLLLVDVLVVNEIEYAAVAGRPLQRDLTRLVAELSADERLPRALVVTVGERGALVWDAGTLTEIPAPRVTVVDTTGAGDTFIGALADALSRGSDLVMAAQWAVHAGALSVASLGATTGMPDAEAVRTAVDTAAPVRAVRPQEA